VSYDINAKVPPGSTQEQVEIMLQNLLADRFGLRLHHESREASGYELVVGKGGPKLSPTTDPSAEPPAIGSHASPPVLDADGFLVATKGVSGTRISTVDNGSMRITGHSQSISDLTLTIAISLNDGKRVVDKTGLTGRYDYKMDLALSGGFRRPGGPPLTADDIPGPDIFAALDKQLGLRLQKTRIPIDVVVIDHLEQKPTDN
jgi:uncharacterized protein (TIGR03435 family)